jgi:hypothetical protein
MAAKITDVYRFPNRPVFDFLEILFLKLLLSKSQLQILEHV